MTSWVKTSLITWLWSPGLSVSEAVCWVFKNTWLLPDVGPTEEDDSLTLLHFLLKHVEGEQSAARLLFLTGTEETTANCSSSSSSSQSIYFWWCLQSEGLKFPCLCDVWCEGCWLNWDSLFKALSAHREMLHESQYRLQTWWKLSFDIHTLCTSVSNCDEDLCTNRRKTVKTLCF